MQHGAQFFDLLHELLPFEDEAARGQEYADTVVHRDDTGREEHRVDIDVYMSVSAGVDSFLDEGAVKHVDEPSSSID